MHDPASDDDPPVRRRAPAVLGSAARLLREPAPPPSRPRNPHSSRRPARLPRRRSRHPPRSGDCHARPALRPRADPQGRSVVDHEALASPRTDRVTGRLSAARWRCAHEPIYDSAVAPSAAFKPLTPFGSRARPPRSPQRFEFDAHRLALRYELRDVGVLGRGGDRSGDPPWRSRSLIFVLSALFVWSWAPGSSVTVASACEGGGGAGAGAVSATCGVDGDADAGLACDVLGATSEA